MKHCYTLVLFTLSCLPLHLAARHFTSLEFVENRGQWAGDFLYKADGGNNVVYLEKGAITYVVGAADNGSKKHNLKHGLITGPQALRFHAYRMQFVNAHPAPSVVAGKKQNHYYNYYLGNDPDKWKSEIHPHLNITYKNLYDGIDLHISSANQQLKYDIVVSPGGKAEEIRFEFRGTDGLTIKDDELYIKTSVGDVKELRPYAYQVINGRKKEVICKYKLEGNVLSYSFPKGYDERETLVIDPTVIFASFIGATADSWGTSATYDAQGNFYAGGTVDVSLGSFPTTLGAFQVAWGGGGPGAGNGGHPCDITITKFNSSGTALIYSTYLGGNNDDIPNSIVVDNNNNLVVAGSSYSANYPTTPGSFDPTHNGAADIIVTKFNAAGTALLGSTFMGGSADDGVNISGIWTVYGTTKHNYGDDARTEVIVDNAGNVYVAASSQSNNFPVTPGAFQSASGGAQDGVVFKLNNTLTSLIWSTYIGGNQNDAAFVLSLNSQQDRLYVAGGTASANFPSTPGTYYPVYQGGTTDGFILKFENGGTYPLMRGTFMGRSNYDQCYGVQVGNDGSVYAMGQTLGGTFPVTPGVYNNPGSSQFIIKLDSNLTTNIFSTVFGSGNSSSPNISPTAFLVDTCENIYVSGWGGNLGGGQGTTTGLPVTPSVPGVQVNTDGNDFYFIVLSKDAINLLYGSFLGATPDGEHVDGGTSRFDKNGVAYQTICGGCGGLSNFPTTPGAWSTTNNSLTNCNLLAVKIAFELGSVDANFTATPTKGCPPLVVSFNNISGNGTQWEWDFGDGTGTSTAQNPPPYTYTSPGVYIVRLIAKNPIVCKTRDTAYVQITVDTNSIKSDFNFVVTDSCNPYRASFTNTSQYSSTPGSQTWTQFTWYWGDGNSAAGANPGPHSYADTGTYTVTLVMTDSTACNNPDTIRKTVTIRNLFLKAGFNAPDSICINAPFPFANTSENASSYTWVFGDGDSSNLSSPSHIYQNTGTYTVTLISRNPNTCNKIDSVQKTIKIKSLPVADFDYNPKIPEINMPIKFTNLSQNAATYLWDFGDNTTSTVEHPSHLYKRTGKYKVCLVARSTEGCFDTLCKTVESDIRPLVDVPTAFSPNGDGNNEIFFVRGGAIETMNIKIFNRWGEMVFESNSLEVGWDGNYKGKPQMMDAYAFVLNVTFIDGSTYFKKGNVTLLR